ncbi:MAG TPA: O-antigen ligase family protein [Solirubrobacteraceae bacterium]|nr:O-antigen ligase family protein [Solirubrobacteraceae bacterium]
MTRQATLLTRLRSEGLPLIPAGITVTVTVAWAATGGGYESQPALGAGYDPGPWYLGALALIGLLGATALGLGKVLRLSRLTVAACVALGAYVLWSFLSILWAHDQGAAFLGSDRALVYFVAFATFAILPWNSWSTRVALGMLVAGLGLLATATAIRLALLPNPASLYLNARLSYPLGYYNADAAMFTMTAVTAISLCSRRDVPAVLRVAGTVMAAVCLQLAVLGQSRGWLFTVPIVLALALVLVPGRLRLLAFTLGPALATAAAAPALLRVYRDATVGGVALAEPRLGEILHRQGGHAGRTMLVADAALAILTTLVVRLDRRIELTAAAQQRVNRLGAAIAAIALLGCIAGGLVATHGDPIGRAERAWSSFANFNNTANGSSRFTTLGSQRVDFWRVAWEEFARHPLTGIGQDNFADGYLQDRRTDQEPRWTHSLELRLLTHTGLVGALLFGLFLLAASLGTLRNRRAGTRERVTVGVALLPLVVWLVHGSIDWLWEFPALSVCALAFAGAGMALGRSPHFAPWALCAPTSPADPRARRATAAAGWVCAALIWAGALAAVAVPYVAARKVGKAIAVWPRRPALAYAELRSASDLMPFDAQIYLVGGAIGLNREEPATAGRWFAEAQRHNDQAWLAPFALGLIEGEQVREGEQERRARARTLLIQAHALNPREPVIARALAQLRAGRPLTFVEAQRILAKRAEQRFGR